MTLDPVLAVAAAALALALISFATQWLFRVRSRSDMKSLQADLERGMGIASGAHLEVKQDLAALELTVRNVPEMPRPGCLNRSTRTQAFQLLRSGVSPDTAASSLGLSKREMRLLERVAHILMSTLMYFSFAS